jgi:hypothetical protein
VVVVMVIGTGAVSGVGALVVGAGVGEPGFEQSLVVFVHWLAAQPMALHLIPAVDEEYLRLVAKVDAELPDQHFA